MTATKTPTVTKTNSRRTTRTDNGPARPAMTAAAAVTFDAVSGRSACQVMEAIDARRATGLYPGCACEPYDAVFTFNRWKAQGMSVRKGEKALAIASLVPVEGKPAEKEGEPAGKGFMIPRTLYLFCRCQVDPQKVKGAK